MIITGILVTFFLDHLSLRKVIFSSLYVSALKIVLNLQKIVLYCFAGLIHLPVRKVFLIGNIAISY